MYDEYIMYKVFLLLCLIWQETPSFFVLFCPKLHGTNLGFTNTFGYGKIEQKRNTKNRLGINSFRSCFWWLTDWTFFIKLGSKKWIIINQNRHMHTEPLWWNQIKSLCIEFMKPKHIFLLLCFSTAARESETMNRKIFEKMWSVWYTLTAGTIIGLNS